MHLGLEDEIGDIPHLRMAVMAHADTLGLSQAGALDPTISIRDLIFFAGNDARVSLEDLDDTKGDDEVTA